MELAGEADKGWQLPWLEAGMDARESGTGRRPAYLPGKECWRVWDMALG